METKTNNRLKLGIFVVVTTLLFAIALYKIGGKRSMFNSTVTINAVFKNVNGLMSGNNVRFGGIEIGTVSKVTIISDTAIQAELNIEKSSFGHITSTSIASIGTDGLMGNKIVNIAPGKKSGLPLKEGQFLLVLPNIELDNALRTLNKTNDNLELITDDVKVITSRFSAKNTLWSLLMDTAVAENVKQTVLDIRSSGGNARKISNGLSEMIVNVNKGKGTLGSLIRDSSLYLNLNKAAMDIRLSSRKAEKIAEDLGAMSDKLAHGEGSIGAMLEDTLLVRHIDESVIDFKRGAANFDSSMEALKHNYFLRKYFKKKDQKNKKNKTDDSGSKN